METFLLSHQATIYGFVYFGVIAFVAGWEAILPRRALSSTLRVRWFGNLGLGTLNNFLSWAVLPVPGFAVATFAAERGVGLFNIFPFSDWITFSVSFVLLDFGRYLEHYLFHYVPLLWRFHAIHHSDQDYDFTTGFRFHPVEWIAIITIELATIAAIGVPIVAFLFYQIMQVIVSIVSHGNIELPFGCDRILRTFVVTPDMHRIHHSAVVDETNSNFGSVLTCWDRLLGSYIDQPAQTHETMAIGLSEFREPQHLTLGWLLTYPLWGDGRIFSRGGTELNR
jgi:sterol desaturase/sphingolipid hydroxylase (fatty acid hydroxylase superfamily)